MDDSETPYSNKPSYGVGSFGPKNTTNLKSAQVKGSYIDFDGANFDPYHASMFRSLLDRSNRDHFPEFYRSYRNNTYTSYACNYLFHQILDNGWHVEGSGARRINSFFKMDDTYDKINYTLGPIGGSSTYGIGMLDLKKKGNRIVSTRPLNPLRIGGMYDAKTGYPVYYYSDDSTLRGGLGSKKDNTIYLDEDYLFINTLNYDPYDPFPIAPLRSSLLFFTILYDMNGDIAEAVKRTAYAPFIVYVNTDGVEEEEKDTYVANMGDNINRMLSASTNLCLDDRHKAGSAGSLGGGAGAQLLPVDSLMVPILSISLTQFGIPLGLLLQQGANKSLIDKQMEDAQRSVLAYRDRFQNKVESLFPHISSRDADFEWNAPIPSSGEMANLRSHYIELLQNDVIDQGFIRDKLDINIINGNEVFRNEGVIQ